MTPIYPDLVKATAPRMIVEAVKLYGTIELPGTADSPTLLGWAKELGLQRIYTHDSIPWCGLFMAIVAKRAGKDLPTNPLWALNWANFGTPQKVAMLGDVLTFKRSQGGHVALYVGEDNYYYHLLGGNQSDKVCLTRKPINEVHSISRPHWKVAQPPEVRQIFRKATGDISTKES